MVCSDTITQETSHNNPINLFLLCHFLYFCYYRLSSWIVLCIVSFKLLTFLVSGVSQNVGSDSDDYVSLLDISEDELNEESFQIQVRINL